MKTGITLLTMGAGNVLVLRKTLESFKDICDEVIYGDLLLFPEDRLIVKSYQDEFNLKIIPFRFDFLYQNGFSRLLNILADHATNDTVMYMNTGEVIDENYGIVEIVKNNPGCNAFYFIHRTDPHRWYRTHNRHELKWSGRIHEQLAGEYKPFHKPTFMMADLPKDMNDQFKANVLDITKELVYFRNYMSIIDNPNELGETDHGWVEFAKNNYDSFKERSVNKGDLFYAMANGNYEAYMKATSKIKQLTQPDFQSNDGIEYQNDKKYLL